MVIYVGYYVGCPPSALKDDDRDAVVHAAISVFYRVDASFEKQRDQRDRHSFWVPDVPLQLRPVISRKCPPWTYVKDAVQTLSITHLVITNLGDTVRWSNFARWDPKMGVFLQSTEATPCGPVLEWKLTPKNPPADTMFMAAMAMVLSWKIVKDFQSFVKIRNVDLHFKYLYLARKWV